MTEDLTTLVCLFHHADQAHAAVHDITAAGIPQSAITLIRSHASSLESAASSLTEIGVPDRDRNHLLDGVKEGGVIVSVSAEASQVSKVEAVFGRHHANKIDEAVAQTSAASAAPLAAAAAMPAAAAAQGETVIPVVEEELSVGKRAVNHGGVRVYRHVVGVPVEESVSLREEHVVVDRQPVNRAATQQDLAQAGERTIELTETAEEAVVAKTARVVEEVHIGKDSTEHAERIHDTVRRTEVEVEEVAPGTRTGNDGNRRGL